MAKLNENSLANKPKSIHPSSAVNLNQSGQQTANAESREFGREINTNNGTTSIPNSMNSAMRKGKTSQCAN